GCNAARPGCLRTPRVPAPPRPAGNSSARKSEGAAACRRAWRAGSPCPTWRAPPRRATGDPPTSLPAFASSVDRRRAVEHGCFAGDEFRCDTRHALVREDAPVAEAFGGKKARARPVLRNGSAVLPRHHAVVAIVDHERRRREPRRDARDFDVLPQHAVALLDRFLHRAA